MVLVGPFVLGQVPSPYDHDLFAEMKIIGSCSVCHLEVLSAVIDRARTLRGHITLETRAAMSSAAAW